MASRRNRFHTVYHLRFPGNRIYIGLTVQVLAHRLSGHLHDARRKCLGGPVQKLIAFYNMPLFDLCEIRVIALRADRREAAREEKLAIRRAIRNGESLLNAELFGPGRDQPELFT